MAIDPDPVPGWERETLQRLAFASLEEQRRTRRWNIFFRLLFVMFMLASLFLYFWEGDIPGMQLSDVKHVALIDIDGLISADTDANADDVVSSLRAAFKDQNTAGVILRVNSPGGSPVQSAYINDEIWYQRGKHPTVPIYAVVSDICASGCYYIASAANKIYANKGSIVGSIGVRMDSFGFVDAIQKLGIERRLLTAGEHKGFLDPFLPQKPEEVAQVKGLLADIHKQFIEVVKKGRGNRLKETPDMFSGLVWTGEQAKGLGLVDEFGSAGYVAREVFRNEHIVDYSKQSDFLDQALEHLGSTGVKALGNIFSSPHID